jgi:hypothetical protein
MILNSFLKGNKVFLNNNQKMAFGRRVISCYKTMKINGLIDIELKKVNINENGVKMEVYDYPREFFQTNNFKRVANKYFREKKVRVEGALFQLK